MHSTVRSTPGGAMLAGGLMHSTVRSTPPGAAAPIGGAGQVKAGRVAVEGALAGGGQAGGALAGGGQAGGALAGGSLVVGGLSEATYWRGSGGSVAWYSFPTLACGALLGARKARGGLTSLTCCRLIMLPPGASSQSNSCHSSSAASHVARSGSWWLSSQNHTPLLSASGAQSARRHL
jgi:hypothetical protein